jgi:hypothetical protein
MKTRAKTVASTLDRGLESIFVKRDRLPQEVDDSEGSRTKRTFDALGAQNRSAPDNCV